MADEEQQTTSVIEVSRADEIGTRTVIVTDESGNVQHMSEDILQQALDEASHGSFEQEVVQFTAQQETEQSITQEIEGSADDMTAMTVLANAVSQAGEIQFDGTNYRVVSGSLDNTINNETEVQNIVDTDALPVENTFVDETEVMEPETTSYTLVSETDVMPEGLGTSHNPIRIIQQGNQYTPIQQLTTDQLQQIMQVVQQQQLAKSTEEGGGSSILYNPQTNTRIVYRVIYPSELHKTAQSQSQQTHTVVLDGSSFKRQYNKRNKNMHESGDEYLDGPELTKEEKDERKKHRPRTRCGRVSKPPKHMVKDYKHIHVLDWNEDYDDSDGGYSDFKYSEDEVEGEQDDDDDSRERSDSPYINPGLGSAKPRTNKCQTCNKAYIGPAGLGRHYRLYPSHGQADSTSLLVSESNGLNTSGNISDDSNTQDSLISIPPPTPRPKTAPNRGRRGRPPLYGNRENLTVAGRRKVRLKELVKQCPDEELMEVVLPRLAKVITLWEFLLMKVEKGRPLRPRVDNMYREFEALHKQVQKLCQTYLSPLKPEDKNNEEIAKLNVTNATVATALGLDTKVYEVRDIPSDDDSAFQYKYLTTSLMNGSNNASQQVQGKRTIQVVMPDQMITQSPSKRVRIATSDISPTVITPVAQTKKAPEIITVRINNPHMSSSKTMTTNLATTSVSNPKSISSTVSPKYVSVVQRPTPAATVTSASRPQVSVPSAANTVKIITSSLNMGQHSNRTQPVSLLTTSPSNVINVKPSAITNSDSIHKSDLPKVIKPQIEVLLPESDKSTTVEIMNGNVDNESNSGDFEMVVDTATDAVEKGPELTVPIEASVEISEDQKELVKLISEVTDQVIVEEGSENNTETEVIALEDQQLVMEGQIVSEDGEEHIITQSGIFQTADGIVIIQNLDGTVQLHGGQSIPLETVQALLAMEHDGQLDVEQFE